MGNGSYTIWRFSYFYQNKGSSSRAKKYDNDKKKSTKKKSKTKRLQDTTVRETEEIVRDI